MVSKHISQLTSVAFCSSAVGIVKSSSANAIVGDNTAVTEAIVVASDVLKKAVLSQDIDVLYARRDDTPRLWQTLPELENADVFSPNRITATQDIIIDDRILMI